MAQTTHHSQAMSRRSLLQRAGQGAAILTAGLTLPELIAACGGTTGTVGSGPQQLTVAYWTSVVPEKELQAVFDGFAKQNNAKVTYFQLPQGFGDTVQKMTTYLSSGYAGLDVLWLDDFMTATFSNANWLAPLDGVVPASSFSAVADAQLKLSTYNGKHYRLPGNFGTVVFFYRKDLFDKEGISVPTTWDELVQAGIKLTKDGVYGLALAGKNGNTELFNEMCYWMGQAGGDPLHMNTPEAKEALQFVYDMLHKHKILAPSTVTDDYTSIQTSFENGKIAMWISWDGLYESTAVFPNVAKNYTLGVAHPPMGPKNNGTIIANWGWAINKYSKNPTMAGKFIEYATSIDSQIHLAKTGSTPPRTDALTNSEVQKALPQSKYDADYVKNVELHYRPITAHAQRVSDAFEQVVNKYLNNQIDLATAMSQGQAAVNQAMQG
ncbi:ABC transporter substrate-binding protein [Dictyobacter arantiisoli]|uniref:ABC transporter substrate-binding protein n=1 Tax=Dictyobacter arantiisoli TaxID=2014874 RepID=A0A5A5THR9_9CHLR|nr:sugar ABC transporter substrate-binding protein [Dictyobacter arantiisoli]GCF10603.1 ABC transporter substrate-binding protein [Dictyobacter arantiisoli]